jgi:hypothetical protein
MRGSRGKGVGNASERQCSRIAARAGVHPGARRQDV